MVSSIQRLGLTPNATIEQRKLAVDLAEVIIKWEFQRVSEYVSINCVVKCKYCIEAMRQF